MTIGEKITTAIGKIVDLYFCTAETDATPYAVYTLDYETFSTKDGPYKYVADVDFAVVAKTATQRDSIYNSCNNAILGMQSTDISVKHENTNFDSDGNVEFISLAKYTITQLI